MQSDCYDGGTRTTKEEEEEQKEEPLSLFFLVRRLQDGWIGMTTMTTDERTDYYLSPSSSFFSLPSALAQHNHTTTAYMVSDVTR